MVIGFDCATASRRSIILRKSQVKNKLANTVLGKPPPESAPAEMGTTPKEAGTIHWLYLTDGRKRCGC